MTKVDAVDVIKFLMQILPVAGAILLGAIKVSKSMGQVIEKVNSLTGQIDELKERLSKLEDRFLNFITNKKGA